jgi:hypothetical protein
MTCFVLIFNFCETSAGVKYSASAGRLAAEVDSVKAAHKVKLLLHAESGACPCADFLHVDFLEPDALKAGAFERPETDA